MSDKATIQESNLIKGNSILNNAKYSSSNTDEWYTTYEAIENVLVHYKDAFRDKVVLCNCDDPYESNFCLYFMRNFNRLRLKKLICTSYAGSKINQIRDTKQLELELFYPDGSPVMTGQGYVLVITKMPGECGGKPGYRMMWQMLKNEGISLSVQTVRKYMNVELGLKSVTRKKKKYSYCKGSEAYNVAKNLLDRNFDSASRNTKWCIDFTYLFLKNGGKRYNCSIIDLYDRRIVASVNGRRIDTKLAIDTVLKALKRSGGKTGMILHSDRGSQFTSKEFTDFCKEHGITQSMSRPGCPYDNAPMERYFNTLKSELIYLRKFSTEESLFVEVNAYAYGWYNNQRPHSHNGGIPPAKVA